MMDVLFLRQTRPEQPSTWLRSQGPSPSPGTCSAAPSTTKPRTLIPLQPCQEHPRVCPRRCLAWSLGAQFGAGLYWEVTSSPSVAIGVPGLYSAFIKPGLSLAFPRTEGEHAFGEAAVPGQVREARGTLLHCPTGKAEPGDRAGAPGPHPWKHSLLMGPEPGTVHLPAGPWGGAAARPRR